MEEWREVEEVERHLQANVKQRTQATVRVKREEKGMEEMRKRMGEWVRIVDRWADASKSCFVAGLESPVSKGVKQRVEVQLKNWRGEGLEKANR